MPAGANVLDVACGSGRHLRWFASRGGRVTGVDRDAAAVEPLHALGRIVVADLETDAWPFPNERFDAVVVTHYLWRPLLPVIVDNVAVGGVLLYETFAQGHETLGKPSNPMFLLKPGELLEAARALRVVAYEDGYEDGRNGRPPRFVQRLAAVRSRSPGETGRRLNSTDCEEPS